VSFRLRYDPAPAAAGDPADLDDALYELAAAGARAWVCLDGYELALDGTGVVELARGCRALLGVIEGDAVPQRDEELRPFVPGAPPEAKLCQWLFSSWMSWIPVVIFAVTPATAWIATRTHAESEGWPLVVLEGRDLSEPVAVPTAEVEHEARGFLDACLANARDVFPSRDWVKPSLGPGS
jgi:hypothetical protein